MTIARLLPFHVHGALEVALGLVIISAAFMLGFEPVAMGTLFAFGGLILAVAFATHAGEHDNMPVSTHLAFDIAFAVAMSAGAVAFAIVGDVAAAAFLGAGGAGLVLLCSLTRFSARGA